MMGASSLSFKQLRSKITNLPEEQGPMLNDAIAELVKIFKDNKEILSGKGEPKPFLHSLVSNSEDAKACPKEILNIILENTPEGKGDTSINAPLKRAIEDGLIDMAEAIIEHMYLKNWTLEDSEEGTKCLQEAFRRQPIFSKDNRGTVKRESIRVESIMKLVTLAKPEMLGKRDDYGLLPLHWAVDFSKCCENPEQQPKLVELLLNVWEQSVEQDVEKGSRFRNSTEPSKAISVNGKFSVYQWHLHTRTLTNSQGHEPSQTTQSKTNGSLNSDRVEKNNRLEMNGKFGEPRRKDSVQLAKEEMRPEMDVLKKKDDSGFKAFGSATVAKYGSEDLRMVSEKDGVSDGKKKPSQSGPKESNSVQLETNMAREAASEKIAHMLGHRFLRRSISDDEDQRRARAFFQYNNSSLDKYQFTFDMAKEGDLSEDIFTGLFSQEKFYRVLRYLALPRVGVRLKKDKTQTERKFLYHSDELFLFHWLREEKKVQKILKVIVHDNKNRPHSDDDIVHVLTGKRIGAKDTRKSKSFDVEILDWRKLDICPEVVWEAVPLVRELHLNWSGRNSVLRGWSEPDGLPKLEFLQDIYLYYTQNVETDERNTAYIDKFRARLNESRQIWKQKRSQIPRNPSSTSPDPSQLLSVYPEIKVHNFGEVNSGSKQGQTTVQEQKQQTDPWVNYIQEFATRIPDLPKDKSDNLDGKFNNITIALIDDGVEIFSPEMYRFLPARFKDHGKGHNFGVSMDGPLSSLSSLSGHGTFMARCILEVCPYANIIPYRLSILSNKGGFVPSPQPESAAQAITAAITEGVDIISMSWTIKQSEVEKSPSFKELQDKIHETGDKQLPLMFCAASDDGPASANGEKWFPRELHKNIFRIGAAKKGQTWPNVTDPKSVHFVFPGFDIQLMKELEAKLQHVENIASNEQDTKTGSSIATAFAVGLAALLIHCTKLGNYYTEKCTPKVNGIDEKSIKSIKQFDTMRNAFEKMSITNTSGEKYPNVIGVFEDAIQGLKKNGRPFTDAGQEPDRIEPIARLIRNLIPQKG